MASKNAEKTIEQAIVSVLSQCYESIEFIIFDSLSTDGTINIVNKYINKIAHFKVERDSSPADAINKAIKISTGEYIMWLATDDWLETDHVSKIVDLFRKSDVDFQYGNLIYIENEKITFKQSGEVDYMNKIKYKMPRLNSPTICVKSSLFESVGLFNIDYKFACDYEWLLRSRKIGHVGYYNNNINVHHRLGGLSTKYFISAANEVRKASIIHGGSAILANYIFLLIILKGYFKISLKVILPNLVYKNLMGYIRSNYRL
jgi:glycosyltransferase involved in cell wall biosynthesis